MVAACDALVLGMAAVDGVLVLGQRCDTLAGCTIATTKSGTWLDGPGLGSMPAISRSMPMIARVLWVRRGVGRTRLAVAITTKACLMRSLRHCRVGSQGGLLGGSCISAVSDW